MAHAEFDCVQSEATGGIGGGAVFFIAHDGMSRLGKLDADLVFTTSIEGQLDQGKFVSNPEGCIVGDGRFGVLVAGPGAVDA